MPRFLLSALVSAIASTLAFTPSLSAAAEVSFSSPPVAKQSGGTTTIRFTVSASTDIEVAVVDAKGTPVRHLAAGVLGGKNPPPAPLKAGLAQELTWDGKDDFGKPAGNGLFKVRVRAGTSVQFGRYVGGDPFTFGALNGIATDAEGNVYVSGFRGDTNQNTITVRAFSPDGSYLRTLLPFSAELKPGEVPNIAKWEELGQRWIPLNRRSLNPTFYPWDDNEANIVSANSHQVVIVSGLDVYRFDLRGALIDGPKKMWSAAAKLPLPNWLKVQIAASPDGKYFYYSNVAGTKYSPKTFAETDPKWPQGRIYRQLAGSGKDPEPFYDLELPDWNKEKFWLADAWNKRTAAYGISTDAKGNVYVCDLVNQGIVEISPEGKKISFTPAPWPERVHVDPASGAYYVISRLDKPKDGRVDKKLVKIAGRGPAGKIVAELPLKGQAEATALGKQGAETVLWISGTEELVCVRDTGTKLEIIPTKYLPPPETQSDFNRMAVDWGRDHVYVNTGSNRIWRYDGMTGKGELLKVKGQVFYGTDVSVGYDGLLYIRTGQGYSGPLERRTWDLQPAPYEASKSHVLTPYVYSRMGIGYSEHGIGVGPDGRCLFTYMYDWNKYCISSFDGTGKAEPGKYLKGKINLPDAKTGKKAMPEGIDSAIVGPLPMSNGGLRVDLQGNIYVGMRMSPIGATPPRGHEKDLAYANWIGCIIKFPPTGGTVLNTETKDEQETGDAKITTMMHDTKKMQVANVMQVYPGVGSFSGNGWGGNGSSCVCRVPRFDIDRYGRLLLPNVVTNSVSLVDNAGNEVITFGKYGNFDALFSADGKEPVAKSVAIPLGWPTSAGFSRNHIYVNDVSNRRVVRVDFKFAQEQTVIISE